jgi:hypothetical protein
MRRRRCAMTSTPSREGAPRRPLPPLPWPISIWQPSDAASGRVWRRPEPLLLGDHYAARIELRAKTAPLPLRVALFGESAAAGYLYAPHLTPAQILERQLRSVGGDGAFEVIDLARTNERLDTLVDTIGSSLQINPDVLVIFAGNNWNLLETPDVSAYAPSLAARQRYASALAEGGPAGPAALAAAEWRGHVERSFTAVATIARQFGIPVVVVVPEINLADWESRQPPIWLRGDGNAQWHRLYRRVQRRLEAGQWTELAALARAMLDLDGGGCPTSHRLLARAEMACGGSDRALAACRAEVDAASYATLCFLGAPQATTQAQELARAASRRPGFACVDLPRIFAQHTGSAISGRRLFLDYCHLTVEGMHVAMAAVAAEVMRFSGMFAHDEDWRALLTRLPPPVVAPAVDATAKLGAALHSAHRLLAVSRKQPILEHWCREALAASPTIAETMLDLAAARLAPIPAALTAAQQHVLASPHHLQYQHGWRWDYVDADLLRAFESVLAEGAPDAARRLGKILSAPRPAGGRRIDLSQAPYLWEPLERFYPDAMASLDRPLRATLRSPWPESSFCLSTDGAHDVDIEVTARLPGIRGAPKREGTAVVRLEGAQIGSCDLGERWRCVSLRVPRRFMRPGLNRLTIEWPSLPDGPGGEAALDDAVTRLHAGLDADLHPVFGELFSILIEGPDQT